MPEIKIQSKASSLVALPSIKVDENRQRSEVKEEPLEELIDSIRRLGLLQPLVIDRELNLIAGFRRYTALQRLEHTHAPVLIFDDLTPSQRALMELEENIKRADLPWRDRVRAFTAIRAHLEAELGDLNFEQLAPYLGLKYDRTRQIFWVAQVLEAQPELLEGADNFSSALSIVKRQHQRSVAHEINRLSNPTTAQSERPDRVGGSGAPPPVDAVIQDSSDAPANGGVGGQDSRPSFNFSVECGDALEFFHTWSGQRFSVLHTDFPYGIAHHRSDQGGADTHLGTYEDTPELYFALLNALTVNIERILYPSAHLIHWFSMKFYTETVEALTEAGFFVVPHPLIWHKTDGRGIASDVIRRPRHTYETALFCSLGDRQIIGPKADSYACATGKSRAKHLSEKPEGMLTHFLSMICDENTEVLDPTCGSGSALRAAHRLGASRIFGLELDPETAADARQEFESHIILSEMSPYEEDHTHG